MLGASARLLRLLSIMQGRPEWTGSELAERVGVTGRTLRRDIARLRELGYPVAATPGVAGGYRLAPGSTLPPLLLDDDEAVAVVLGLRGATGHTVTGIAETSLRALGKLERILPARLRQRAEALRSTQDGSFQPQRDAHSWLRFVFAAHHRQAQRVKRRSEWTVRLWNDLARLAAERGLPERVVSALYGAAVGEVRRTTYQQDEDLSRDQAIRDIQALTRAGLLAPRGNATTRVYLLAGAATDIAQAASAAVRGPGRDPYTSS